MHPQNAGGGPGSLKLTRRARARYQGVCGRAAGLGAGDGLAAVEATGFFTLLCGDASKADHQLLSQTPHVGERARYAFKLLLNLRRRTRGDGIE